jgi:two-component SAPR family response regulator
MTGIELIAEVSKLDKSIPCILASSEADEYVTAATNLGAGTLLKPFTLEQLETAVRKYFPK